MAADQSPAEDEIDRAQFSSFYNRNSVLSSQMAGCFYCLNTFPAYEVVDWLDEQYEQQASAICLRCKAAAVLGDSSGYPIEKEFLERMHLCWYQQRKNPSEYGE